MSASTPWDESILIVDDNPENLRYLASLLDGEGYSVRAALNGAMALSAVESRHPDLILLDVMMPEMDGYETLRKIKDLQGEDAIPVIFLTGKVGEEEIVRGFEEGAVDYVGKPFHPLELLSRVRTHLGLRRRDRTIERIRQEQQNLLRYLTHDLAGNLGSLDSLAMMTGTDPDRALEFVAFARRDLGLCLDGITMVRKLMELEYDRMNLALEETELGQAIQDALALQGEGIRKKELTIEKEMSYSGLVCADRVSLVTTVLRNILHNAIKFTPRGGGIRIASNRESGFAELTISDTGKGISQHLRERAFQVDRNPSTPGTEEEMGSGYGLFLAGRFMEAYDASISVDPDQGKGTTVRMRFRIP